MYFLSSISFRGVRVVLFFHWPSGSVTHLRHRQFWLFCLPRRITQRMDPYQRTKVTTSKE